MTEDFDLCSTCKTGYLKPTGETIVPGESAGVYVDIGTRRVFQCENCGQRSVRVANQEYVGISNSVRTKSI
jgi:hypothetical protein